MRGGILLGLGGALLAMALAGEAVAQGANWPDKPVKLILPYAPGGATDLIGRPWADKLGQVFGQQFVIENRGGAGGMIGTEAAAKAAPDGYTFLLTPNATLTILPSLRQAPYDAIKSFDPVGRVGDLVSGFVIHPAVGVKTFKELIEYAKTNPGKLAYGSAGLGTATQLRVEMLKYRAGIDILHVPYRGSADALNDLLPNTVQMMNEINVLPHVKAGKLVLLNINYPIRHPDFPDVPTLTELGYPDSDVPICLHDLCACRHAEGDRGQAQRQAGRDRQERRDDCQDAGHQRDRAAAVARGGPRLPCGRHQAQRRADQGRQHQARVGSSLFPSAELGEENDLTGRCTSPGRCGRQWSRRPGGWGNSTAWRRTARSDP